jgi:dTDP-4-amino-4,6-dideoxygalactose transaminase
LKDLVEEFWSVDLVERLYAERRRVSSGDFRDALHQRFERRGKIVLTGSARQALAVVLRRMAENSPRRKVLMSNFNCRVVRAAALQLGMQVETFDFATANGQVDWEKVGELLGEEHLAVLVPHFFGIPADFRRLMDAARRHQVFVIEDCAHTLGARIGGVTAGQIGDAAIFSFNYDKPISLAGGGALLINDIGLEVDGEAIEVSPPREVELAQFKRTAAALRARRQRRGPPSFIARVATKLGVGPYVAQALPAGIGPLRAAVGIWQLERYDGIRDRRNENARTLMRALAHLSWHVEEGVAPAYLKMRVVVPLADSPAAIEACARRGITVANSNWPRVLDPSTGGGFRSFAQVAAELGVEIPVHQNLSASDLEAIAASFATARSPQEVLGSSAHE